MAENFPNLGKETDFHIREAQRSKNKMNPRRTTPRHIIIKMLKVKEKTLETEKGEKKNLLHIRESPKGYPQIFQQKVCMPEWTGMTYSKC